jgi:hypothetical protein
VRSLHRIFALLTLLGWLSAIGHLVLEDGGVTESGAWHAENGAAHQHSDDSDHGRHLHHHDLSVMAGRLGSKISTLPALATAWVLLSGRIAELLAATPVRQSQPVRESAHADRRTSGWLLVCRTALPVRGPSLAA